MTIEEETLLKYLPKKEIQKKKCKNCGLLKKRIFDGMFDKRNKRWKDEDGLVWNGHVCGSCHQLKMRSQMREKRNEKIDSGNDRKD